MSPVRENLHTAFTSFHKVLAALPRWVLSTRTPFASLLAQSFFGSAPASVVYPLPLADFRLFGRGIPKFVQEEVVHSFEEEVEAYHHHCSQLSPWWNLPQRFLGGVGN